MKFTDATGKSVSVNVTGPQSHYTANLSTLANGTITSSLAVNTDPFDNRFTPVAGTTVTLDQDKVAEAPSLTTSGNIIVPAGGSKPLGITVTPIDSDDTLSVKISNVPSFETITAPNGDVVTHNGSTYTITAPIGQAINNLVVHSSYKGKGLPQNTFNITATNLTVGETATSASKSIIVTDPPATAPSVDHVVALFNQYMAAGFPEQHGGSITTNALSQDTANAQQSLANPHHG